MENVNGNIAFLKRLIGSQLKVLQALAHGLDEKYSDESLLNYFNKVDTEALMSNTAVASKCADYFQLLNEEENYKGVELSDIEKLYFLFVKIHPFDISMYENLSVYVNSVQDRPEDAKKILKDGIDIVEAKISELKIAMGDFD